MAVYARVVCETVGPCEIHSTECQKIAPYIYIALSKITKCCTMIEEPHFTSTIKVGQNLAESKLFNNEEKYKAVLDMYNNNHLGHSYL